MRLVVALAALVALSACGTTNGMRSSRPVSIGGGANSLKRAPCACEKIKQRPGLPEFLQPVGEGVAA